MYPTSLCGFMPPIHGPLCTHRLRTFSLCISILSILLNGTLGVLAICGFFITTTMTTQLLAWRFSLLALTVLEFGTSVQSLYFSARKNLSHTFFLHYFETRCLNTPRNWQGRRYTGYIRRAARFGIVLVVVFASMYTFMLLYRPTRNYIVIGLLPVISELINENSSHLMLVASSPLLISSFTFSFMIVFYVCVIHAVKVELRLFRSNFEDNIASDFQLRTLADERIRLEALFRLVRLTDDMLCQQTALWIGVSVPVYCIMSYNAFNPFDVLVFTMSCNTLLLMLQLFFPAITFGDEVGTGRAMVKTCLYPAL